MRITVFSCRRMLRIENIFTVVTVAMFASTANAAINCVAPPTLSNPMIYDGKCPGDPGFPDNVKANGRDVYIKMPTNKICSKGFSVSGAHNVRIIGGTFVYNDTKTAVVTIKSMSGISLIEGMNIDVNKKSADAIRAYNHKGKMIIENTFVRGVSGTPKGTHGDMMQAQGGGPLQELTLQNVTGLTGYQGLFTPYQLSSGCGTHKLTVDRVNVGYDPAISKSAGAGRPLMLLFMGSADDSVNRVPDRGTVLSNTYVDGSYWNVLYTNTVYAKPTSGSGGCATFDSKQKISGQVCNGKPAQGDFAPAAQVGMKYNRAQFCNN